MPYQCVDTRWFMCVYVLKPTFRAHSGEHRMGPLKEFINIDIFRFKVYIYVIMRILDI